MKTTAIILAITATALLATTFMVAQPESSSLNDDHKEWTLWKMQHGKAYGTNTEEETRRAIFYDNLNRIEAFNNEENGASFSANFFADLTKSEFATKYTGLNKTAPLVSTEQEMAKPAYESLQSKDWVKEGAVQAVRDQGQCGSCWAFSTVGSVESALYLGKSKTVDLAEQELVDCDNQDSGCNGGLMTYGMEYVKKHGLDHESDYPYQATDGSCRKVAEDMDAAGGRIVQIPARNEKTLVTKMANYGPVSVAVCASSQWQFYTGGVLSSCCSQLDHGVLLVAYNDSQKASTIRNSWGASWGENGYIRLKYGKNVCGYASQATLYTFNQDA